jgi:hypothetical protein
MLVASFVSVMSAASGSQAVPNRLSDTKNEDPTPAHFPLGNSEPPVDPLARKSLSETLRRGKQPRRG